MLRIHQPPAGEIAVQDYQVTVNGENAGLWFCRVSAMPYNTVWPGYQRPMDQTEIASFLSFEMDEPVTIRVKAAKPFSEAVVRPLSRRIVPEINGQTLTFTVACCGQYTLELDGWHNALHIFANPVTDFSVRKDDPRVRYYAPGVHDIGNLELEDGETLFVDGGAVLYGSVTAIGKKNVRIVGYGVIDGSREVRTSDTGLITWGQKQTDDYRNEDALRRHLAEKKVLNGCVHLYSCTDSEICGITARDSSTFAYILANCENCDCSWIKTIGMWRYNSDGIDLFNSRYIRIANGFFRDFDDCIVIKGIEGWDHVNQHHISVTRCTVWCDWGRGLELGAETNADEYSDILWDDCDLIHGSHIHIDLHNTGRAWIHDMLVRNIRCEYSRYDLPPVYQHDMNAPYPGEGQPYVPVLIASPIYDGPYSLDHVLGRTSRVRFEDIQILDDGTGEMPVCEFIGQDEIHCNKEIVIENVTRNGQRLVPCEVPLKLGEFDRDITVK